MSSALCNQPAQLTQHRGRWNLPDHLQATPTTPFSGPYTTAQVRMAFLCLCKMPTASTHDTIFWGPQLRRGQWHEETPPGLLFSPLLGGWLTK